MSAIRIFIDSVINSAAIIHLSEKQSHYILNVMRRRVGDELIIFNGRDGEWSSVLDSITKKHAIIAVRELLKTQKSLSTVISVAFAPVKNYSSNLVVQKLTELGAGEIYPMITERTIIRDVNIEKLRLSVIEAAEQSERIDIPVIHSINSLKNILDIHQDSAIIFCDEAENEKNILEVIYKKKYDRLTLLIGPEGGFTESERLLIKSSQLSFSVTLNPYTLRSETAAFTALAIVQASIL